MEISPLDIQLYRTRLSKYCHALSYYEREMACENTARSSMDHWTVCDPLTSRHDSKAIIEKRIQGYRIFQYLIESFLLLVVESQAKKDLILFPNSNGNGFEAHSMDPYDFTTDLAFLTATVNDYFNQMDHAKRSMLEELFSSSKKVVETVSQRLLVSPSPVITEKIIRSFYHNFPEIVKLSLEFSFELLNVLKENIHYSSSLADHQQLMMEIVSYMEILFAVLPLMIESSQRVMILEMQKEFQHTVFVDVG
jgi:hypothetical protein